METPVLALARQWEETFPAGFLEELNTALQRREIKTRILEDAAVAQILSDSVKKASSLDEIMQEIRKTVNRKCETEDPDLLIVELPGVLQEASEEYPNDHGVAHFLMTKALEVDFLVLAATGNCEITADFDRLIELAEYRTGVKVDVLFCSLFYVDFDDTENIGELVSYRIDENEIEFESSRALVVVQEKEQEGIEKIVDAIFEKLSPEENILL